MGEIIAIAVALIIYLVFAKYINYMIEIIALVCPDSILKLILLAISVSVVLFIVNRKSSD